MSDRLARETERRKVDASRRLSELRQSIRTNEAPAAEQERRLEKSFDFSRLPEFAKLSLVGDAASQVGLPNPFFRTSESRDGGTVRIRGRELINFSSYDYLGLSFDSRLMSAAMDAARRYGMSSGASRLVGGECRVHRDLESELAALHRADAAVSFVSGHATNVSLVGTLLGPEDLVVADARIHNSILEGARLAGAKRLSFPHNDMAALADLLESNRHRYRRALVASEGMYGMDGDCPDLAQLIDIKDRYECWLMVDEAHSIGVLGVSGAGIAQEQGVDPRGVDIWMGTLSKSLASCGGYVAGSAALIEILKYSAAGFVYSVGISPPLAASAHAALAIMQRETWRVERIRENSKFFLEACKREKLDTGSSIGRGVVPVIVGGSIPAVRLSAKLFECGINALPILHPAVPEKSARLRFFITAQHTQNQLAEAVQRLAAALREL